MLLGAWSEGSFSKILDIGTGTGMLALMMAQKNPQALITAIEPNEDFLNEAISNFSSTAFSGRIESENCSLQHYKTTDKFDLILTNPPYFENSSRSENELRNDARHTETLPIRTIYECAAKLLAAEGELNLVFPHDIEARHFEEAGRCDLHPCRILRTTRDDGQLKRTLVSYKFGNSATTESTMIVKHSDNRYSDEYIRITEPFYAKSLANRGY